MAAAATVASPPFEFVFDRVLSFAGSGAFVLRGDDGTAPVTAFRQGLDSAIQQVGLRIQPSHTAHMTLLYDEGSVPEQAMEPVRWAATEFVLVHSLVGQQHHEWLGRWPLRGGH